MLPKGKRGVHSDRSGVQAAASMGTTTTLYVYETSDINANPQANTGHLVTLPLAEGTPAEILYRLAQQFPGGRCFVHSLESEEFQGWKEVSEKNVKSIGENLRVRNQLKVVKQSPLTLAFHDPDLLDKLVAAIVGKLKKDITLSDLSSMDDDEIQIMEESAFCEHQCSPEQHLRSGAERLCLTEESFATNENWAKVRERARGVLHLKYP